MKIRQLHRSAGFGRSVRRGLCLLLSGVLTAGLLTGCGAETSSEVQNDVAVVNYDTTGQYVLNDETGEAIISGMSSASDVVLTDADNEIVFYQIFVGSFSDSDGDGIGDLRGIINRFDYLNDGEDFSGESLGVEGIWLSPIFESPSYHKYDVTDYYAVDDDFGTMDDLIELVNLCHERGVKIILDLPINHTGSKNQWFLDFCTAHRQDDTENEYYDFYSYNSVGNENGKAYYKISAADEYYEGNFSSDMPELNFDNDEVRDAVVDIARYYLEDIGVDGFRFDAAKYIYYGNTAESVDFWVWYMDQLTQIDPDIYTVAEVWSGDNEVISYNEALNCFNFTMSQVEGKISETAKKGDANKYVSYLDYYVDSIQAERSDAFPVLFLANHDTDRAAGYMTLASGMAQVAANLYILTPGSCVIYYGEEIAMKGTRGGSNTDANRRLAMFWGDGDTVEDPEGATYEASKQTNGSVADQLGNGASLYNYYKKLIMIRKANPEIALGEFTPLSFSDTRVGGFVSTYEGSCVCVIHNTTGSTETIDLSEATGLSFTEINASIGYIGEDYVEASLDGTILTIPAQTSVVLR